MTESIQIKHKFFEGIDFVQRVNNFRLKPSSPEKALMPIFEAIANACHSIEESGIEDGKVQIVVERLGQEVLELEGIDSRASRPILNFIIQDNGIGFDNQHFNAFVTSDTAYKSNSGGRGIGRYSWLKSFDNVKVESIFKDDEKSYKRSFQFAHTQQAIHDLKTQPCGMDATGTIVRLSGFKMKFREGSPKTTDAIARRIIEHFLLLFLGGKAPIIEVVDDIEEERLVLNKIFNSGIKVGTDTKEFKVDNHTFYLDNIKLYTASESSDHRIHLCGQGREVVKINLAPKLPFLKTKTRVQDEDGRAFIYIGYVKGKYLDENLTAERTEFDIPEKKGILYKDASKFEIIEEALVYVQEFLNSFVEKIVEENKARINAFIKENYKYRPLLEFKKDKVHQIKPNISDQELDIELHKILSELETEVKRKKDAFLSESYLANEEDIEKRKEIYHRFIDEYNTIGRYKLAEYVIHRKAILDLLDKKIRAKDNGKFSLEEEIHDIFYPMRRSTNNAFVDQRNLWIIDEKLAYHQYLASDKRMNTYENIKIDSKQRPDIAIFDEINFLDNSHAFTNEGVGFSHVVIIEFKKPMRANYDYDEDPIAQVNGYAEKIRNGEAKNSRGTLINVAKNTPFYCYIVCDLTHKIVSWARNAMLTETPHKDGFFGYNSNYNTFIEIMSFDKLILDASKRNKVLFDQLNLPNNT